MKLRTGLGSKARLAAALLVFFAAGLLLCISIAGEGAARAPGAAARIPWTSSRMQGSPDPPSPYRTERLFPGISFNEPLDACFAPRSRRMFVVERAGKIFSFDAGAAAPQAELLIDLGKVAYGMAVHPRFQENGYIYVVSIIDAAKTLPHGTRLTRFQASRGPAWRCDPATETLILEWPMGGHNGGCLQFGLDGFLYAGTGDSSGIADELLTGQDPGDLPGSILRIDVDHPDAGKPYGIPRDNPFVGKAWARPEIWAYGLRQPWKFSFDRSGGDLWTGNVGQDLWESVCKVERGGNYGWSVTEGSHTFRPERQRGPTPILPPILEYNHTEGRSITGGFVYRGARLRELEGAYIYGDFDTGRIWGLRFDGRQVTWQAELVDTSLRLVGFAEDGEGELYLVDYAGGGMHRLVPAPQAPPAGEFPRRLSRTGLFASAREHTLAPGVLPYSIIAPMWSDGARKQWFLALPGESRIDLDAIAYPQPAPGAPPGWKFPDGTVIGETISMEMEKGNPASARRLETRISHHERLSGKDEFGDQYWREYTYIWNDDQSDAELLEDPQGRDVVLPIRDASAPDGVRKQTWHVPGRAECTTCHNLAAKYVIGINTPRFNRDFDGGGPAENQLLTLERLGMLAAPLPGPPASLPRLADPEDAAAGLDRRARAYLHANCSHCHRKWGGGNTEFQLLYFLEPGELGIIETPPGQGSFQIDGARVLAAGDPCRSILYYRMAALGPARMPRLGSAVVDERGLRLLRDWISSLAPGKESAAGGQGGARERDESALARLRDGSTSADLRKPAVRALLDSTSGSLRLLAAVDDGGMPAAARGEAIAAAAEHASSEVRNLFERFQPEEQRARRLGSIVRPEEILALPGDEARGRKIFFDGAAITCKNCHRIQGQGNDLGPDLGGIGKRYDRAQILESILEPSKKIDPQFVVQVIETRKGQFHSGIVIRSAPDEVLLKGSTNEISRIPRADIRKMTPQTLSMMPELLLRDLTAREVADLTAFLSSLKGP